MVCDVVCVSSTYCVADTRVLHLNQELVTTHLIEDDWGQFEWCAWSIYNEGLGFDVRGGIHDCFVCLQVM